MYTVHVQGCRAEPYDGFYYPEAREDFGRHDILARNFARAGYKSAIVWEDGEPVAIWSHADH